MNKLPGKTLKFQWPSPVELRATLQSMLDSDVPRKFYLTDTACQRILHRYSERNKVLPGNLYNALMGHGETSFAVYSLCSAARNSMKSHNPHSGCPEIVIARCIDTTDPNPSKNQGGVAIVQ